MSVSSLDGGLVHAEICSHVGTAALDPICNFITRASLRSLLFAIVFARCVAFLCCIEIMIHKNVTLLC